MKKKLVALMLCLTMGFTMIPSIQASEIGAEGVTQEIDLQEQAQGETGSSGFVMDTPDVVTEPETDQPWEIVDGGTEPEGSGDGGIQTGPSDNSQPQPGASGDGQNAFSDGSVGDNVQEVVPESGDAAGELTSGAQIVDAQQEGESLESGSTPIQVAADSWIKNADGTFSLKKTGVKGAENLSKEEEQAPDMQVEEIFLQDAVPQDTVSQDSIVQDTVPAEGNEDQTAFGTGEAGAEALSGDPQAMQEPEGVQDPEATQDSEAIQNPEGNPDSEDGQEPSQSQEEDQLPPSEEEHNGEQATEITQEPDAMEADVSGLFTSTDGLVYIKTGNRTPGYYYFDEKGIMTVGTKKVSAGTPGFGYAKEASYFFMDAASLKDNNAHPASSTLGQLQKDYWNWDGKAFHYYDAANGRELTVDEYTSSLDKYYGYVKVAEGQYYCLNSSGIPQTGYRKLLDKGNYYFKKDSEIPGLMVRNGWATEKEGAKVWWRYFDTNGKFTVAKSITATRLDASLDSSISSTAIYLLSPAGYMYKNAMRRASDGYYYYVASNGRAVTNQKRNVNGKTYYFGGDGRMVKDKIVTVSGKRYYFSKAGYIAWKNQWHKVPCDSNRFYYFAKDGSIVKKTGWQSITVNGKWYGWYYFTSSGRHYIDRMNTSSLGYKYYFKTTGALAGGRTLYQGKYYYFNPPTKTKRNGQMKKGVIKNAAGQVTYYANDSTGVLITGWKNIGGSWYYFGSNNATVKNKAMKKGNVWGRLDGTGVWKTGWIRVTQADSSQKSYYINPQNGEYYKNCWQTIDGLNYYFTGDGSIHRKLDQLPGFATSSTRYAISLNRSQNVMTIYTSDWKTPVRCFSVSVGKPETPTPTGPYTVTSTGQRWTELMGPSWGQWALNIFGGYFIHSVPNTQMNPYTLYRWDFCMLRTAQSHGCVRMTVSDCYWVYSHCNGSQIRIYDDEPLPLGLSRKWWIPENQNYDPTDWNVPENKLNGPVW